jgi:hypothetical protein
LSEKPCGAYFFAFFENFFVPILTSGGPASFIMPLQIGKTPIVLSNRLDTKDYCFYIDENSIFAENRQLPHKDAGIFDDFYMIPVKKGDDAEKNAVIISLKNGE